jgi:ABC-type branched-subunit amino acid transport system ATPase component
MSGPVLEIRELGIAFGGLKAVDKVSFSAQRNRITTVIGPNGAGKSTLFNLISGALKPKSGQLLIDGVDMTGASPARTKAAGLSRSFQITNLFFELTVAENLRMAAQVLEPTARAFLRSAARPGRSPRPARCSSASSSATSATNSPAISRMATSAGSRSRSAWRRSRRSCCSTSRRRA